MSSGRKVSVKSPGADFRVVVEPAGSEFPIAAGETVLSAAERHGVALKYGCRRGNCATCKYYLAEGIVDFGRASPYALSQAERDDGFALLCCAQPMSDLVVWDNREPDHRALPVIPPFEYEASVQSVEELSLDLIRLRLRLGETLKFYAGQFVELAVPDAVNEWRSYSIASAPTESRDLELIIKLVPGGLFTGQCSELSPGAPMRLRGPLGDSYLRHGRDTVLLVGAGSGIAPLVSMLRAAANAGDERSFVLVYGARTRRDLVVLDDIMAIAHAHQIGLDVLPVLSKPTPQCQWTGRTGHVTNVVQGEIDGAESLDAYVCGKPEMCDAIELLLEAKGIKESHLILERFYATSKRNSVTSTRS